MGKLIIIEGSDGSGKETQSKRLEEALEDRGLAVRRIEFPNYSSPSSTLVKMYLTGKFGDNANDVNPYAASTFYAVDRFSSFQTDWKTFYQEGGIIIADRYSISNMIHQGSKISDPQALEDFLTWVEDFEFNKMGIPKPDKIIFLDVLPEISIQLIKARSQGSDIKDIHENDMNFLKNSHAFASKLAEKLNWNKITCVENGELLSIEVIHQKILDAVSDML